MFMTNNKTVSFNGEQGVPPDSKKRRSSVALLFSVGELGRSADNQRSACARRHIHLKNRTMS